MRITAGDEPDCPGNEAAGALGRDDFAGRWHVARKITDHRGGQSGAFDGQAVFTPDGRDRLIYREEGVLTLAQGGPLKAERTYLWQFAADVVTVSFEDGRPFHSFALRAHAAGSDHLCGRDLYQVVYDFALWPVWQAVWQVAGPAKDYVSHSAYQRVGVGLGEGEGGGGGG